MISDVRLVSQNLPFDGSLDWLISPVTGIDQTRALSDAVLVALNTDRRALPADILPQLSVPGQIDDRRGWWGDLDASEIWKGWPIGTRLWIMQRDAITDSGAKQGSTIARATRYIKEALDPFVAAKIFSRFQTDLAQTGQDRIEGTITIYRGPKALIALQYQPVWTEIEG